jgi:hypothetical protein
VSGSSGSTGSDQSRADHVPSQLSHRRSRLGNHDPEAKPSRDKLPIARKSRQESATAPLSLRIRVSFRSLRRPAKDPVGWEFAPSANWPSWKSDDRIHQIAGSLVGGTML